MEHEIAGTRLLNCQLCDQPTFFSPSSFTRPEASYATFVCLSCAAKMAESADTAPVIAPPTDAQLREIAEAMKARRP